jgi:hypothetical protein
MKSARRGSINIILILLLVLFSVKTFAQDSKDMASEAAQTTPNKDLNSGKSTEKKIVRVKRPPPPPRTLNSAFISSYSIYRFMQIFEDGNTYGYFNNQTGLNTPGSTYILSSFVLRSTENSRSQTDLQSFALGMYFYSPQINGFGLVGNYGYAGPATDTWRLGFYHVLSGTVGSFNFAFNNYLLSQNTSGTMGRYLNFYAISTAMGGVALAGNFTYTWNREAKDPFTVIAVDPALTFSIIQNLRGSIMYNYSKVSTVEKATSWVSVGIDFSQKF